MLFGYFQALIEAKLPLGRRKEAAFNTFSLYLELQQQQIIADVQSQFWIISVVT
jgi:hypothetical protein